MNPIRNIQQVLKMKTLGSILILLGAFAICGAIPPPASSDENNIISFARQDIDIFANSRKLIEELAENLSKAAREAGSAIVTFSKGVQDEALLIRHRVANDIEKLRTRVAAAIENVTNRLVDSGVAVGDCVRSHRGDANALFNQTLSKTMACVDNRIAEISDQIKSLAAMVQEAVDFANVALVDMRQCSNGNGNFLSTGSCLGTVAVQTEMKAVVFGTQSALNIARINLSIATLPASLEVCAASRLVETGLSTARIVMDIGTCSAATVFVTMTGDNSVNFGNP